jgi:hypothetical protein
MSGSTQTAENWRGGSKEWQGGCTQAATEGRSQKATGPEGKAPHGTNGDEKRRSVDNMHGMQP